MVGLSVQMQALMSGLPLSYCWSARCSPKISRSGCPSRSPLQSSFIEQVIQTYCPGPSLLEATVYAVRQPVWIMLGSESGILLGSQSNSGQVSTMLQLYVRNS